MDSSLSFSGKAWQWICRYPLLLLLIGHCVFSLGIWNVEVGFGEDTPPLRLALNNVHHHTLSANLYVDLFTAILAVLTPDPLSASVVMRFLVSLLTTVALFLVLSRFTSRLRIEAILLACFVWIASRLNAPEVVYTNVSGFAFAVMLIGIYFLFSPRKLAGCIGFVLFSALAVSLRPEWIAPFLLIVVYLAGELVWKVWRSGALGRKTVTISLLALVVIAAASFPFARPRLQPAANRADAYLLMGLGQCYGNFLKGEHPEMTFDPMTEYQSVLDRTFGHPSTIVEAVRNNPKETMRYFEANTVKNLRRIPEELLSTRGGSTQSLIARPHSVLLYGVLFVGGICAAIRLGRRRKTAAQECADAPTESASEFGRKLVVLVLLSSASSVAILMLVGSPRYWISIVPLLYFVIAFCADSLMKAIPSPRFAIAITACALVFFCRPNFLDRKGNNYDVRNMRAVAPLVRQQPVIGALWAEPLVVYGFHGEAKGISAWDGIKAEDITAGRVDVLNVSRGFRASQTWATQQVFFESFEENPAQYGFKKLDGLDAGQRAVYYRPMEGTK